MWCACLFPNFRRYVMRLPTEGWPGWGDWVVGSAPRWFTRPKTVTHPGTNRARRSATSLIKTNALPLNQTVKITSITGWPKNWHLFLIDGIHETPKSICVVSVNPLECRGHIERYEVGTLAVDGWAVTFGTAGRGLGGAAARPGLSSLYQM